MTIHEQFTKCYPVTKTLRFSLIPQYETMENVKKYGIIDEDEEKIKNYEKVKPIFDKCHRMFIEESLSGVSLDWGKLAHSLDGDDDNSKDGLDKVQKEYCKNISKAFKNDNKDLLVPDKLISAASKPEKNKNKYIEALTIEEKEIIKSFDKFATYFEGYRQTRDNIYAEEGVTSIANRVVVENFTKFYNNCHLYEKLPDTIKNQLNDSLMPFLNGLDVSSIFSIDYYNNLLTQTGIESFNNLLGGMAIDEKTKIQGLNEICNLEYQKGTITRKVIFAPLYKQILSETSSLSFLPSQFESDIELLDALVSYDNTFDETFESDFATFIEMFESESFDASKVYVDKKQVSSLSIIVFGDWAELSYQLSKKGLNKTIYSLDELFGSETDCLDKYILCLKEKYNDFTSRRVSVHNHGSKIENYNEIKAYLDSVLELEHTFKIFDKKETLKLDEDFYNKFDDVYDKIIKVIPLYNKVRNYATKKPYSTEKIKLNFGNSTLASGWDQSKEFDNNTLLFEKNGEYFLGIYNSKNKQRINESVTPIDNGYRKMIYKLLPGPNKMLPKVFFSKKGREKYGTNKYIDEGYAAGKHKKGENFDLDFCHDLIDYFKLCISKNESWSAFNFKFSDTETYNDMSDFYNEVSEQGYKISFSYVSNEDMLEMVSSGKMFLFKIYNKDFSKYSTGNKNLYSLNRVHLFSDENLDSGLINLNGEAELFFRHASIENPFVHAEGSILLNKLDKNNNRISDDDYQAIMDEISAGASLEQLVNDYPEYSFRKAPHAITKDKRYTKDQFNFHVSITLNSRGTSLSDRAKDFNGKLNEILSSDKDVNIIGIDRGERNLLYVSCIDQKGNIIEQKSLNVINNVDYLDKLKQIARQRDESRKNWTTIGNIKEMKQGYLSLVIHEITSMMIKYNAILVLEDLNSGFKNNRKHIEQQIYQNFEVALISKLNYLAFKDVDPNEIGGINVAYQLSPKTDNYQDIRKQTGFVLYVPAAYTSKIDFKTGFVNLFTRDYLKYSSVNNAKDFISRFDDIRFNKEENYFEFEFDYSNFELNKKDYQNHWAMCSYGNDRIVYSKQDKKYKYVNVTEELIKLFDGNNIDYTSNLKEQILGIEENGKSFFSSLLYLINTLLMLRYEDEDNDFILSPIKNEDGYFYDTRYSHGNEPVDGDANGAYHIALEGLRLISNIKDNKIGYDAKGMQTLNWLTFVQEAKYKK